MNLYQGGRSTAKNKERGEGGGVENLESYHLGVSAFQIFLSGQSPSA